MKTTHYRCSRLSWPWDRRQAIFFRQPISSVRPISPPPSGFPPTPLPPNPVASIPLSSAQLTASRPARLVNCPVAIKDSLAKLLRWKIRQGVSPSTWTSAICGDGPPRPDFVLCSWSGKAYIISRDGLCHGRPGRPRGQQLQ